LSSGTGSPGWSRKKGHKTVVVKWLWWWLKISDFDAQRCLEFITLSDASTLFVRSNFAVMQRMVRDS